MAVTWVEGAGSSEVPVLSHVFDPYLSAPERYVCTRCGEFVPPLDSEDRCPSRLGQDRGLTQ